LPLPSCKRSIDLHRCCPIAIAIAVAPVPQCHCS
jgi:hypothetical protein